MKLLIFSSFLILGLTFAISNGEILDDVIEGIKCIESAEKNENGELSVNSEICSKKAIENVEKLGETFENVRKTVEPGLKAVRNISEEAIKGAQDWFNQLGIKCTVSAEKNVNGEISVNLGNCSKKAIENVEKLGKTLENIRKNADPGLKAVKNISKGAIKGAQDWFNQWKNS